MDRMLKCERARNFALATTLLLNSQIKFHDGILSSFQKQFHIFPYFN